SPVHVYGDPGQLEQILFNLAANARDAMPAGGRLSMETELVELDHTALVGRPGAKPGRYCLLAVRDTGVGMDAETMERAFEPFFTTKDPGQGTGLGLATVYGVVQQSKGQVWLYSEVGKGTTVKVYLPEAPLAQSLAPAPRPAQQDYSGTETVLLVEDDRVIRRMANAALGRFGYRVLVASNGEEGLAMALAHEGDIDLLVTDVVMPGMSGHALFARLHPLRPRLKVLYVSGYTEDVLRERGGLDANAQVLEKPFTHLTLGKHIREILDRK
ncbi:MAG: response regulator, partial [Deltaproteobacteria bacterium]|nr:response regulator [Deltaproteobacteria bacterium]